MASGKSYICENSASRRVPARFVVHTGIDTWGIDYGLLDSGGRLLAEPVAYRDTRTAGIAEQVHRAIRPEDLYTVSGVQFLPFNTVYQLVSEQAGSLWSRASHAVLIPDLLAYWLTGELRTEITNASTTGLLDVREGTWSGCLLNALSIPPGLLPELEHPGTVRGVTADGTPVVTVGSHDTASAVVGVPATTEHFAYISSGTWSLVGLEIEHPVLTEDARRANFTNEVGIDGRIRFLRNVGGLWLLQECLREWGGEALHALLGAAAQRPSGGPRIDVGDPDLVTPGDMPARIVKAALGGAESMERPAIVRCILDSLADAHARAIRQASTLASKDVEVVHVVGGGSQNGLLCQLTADATALPVLAGPVEATALGNIAVQARSRGAFPGSLEDIRARIAACTPLGRYEPR
ncbi:MAG TPA: FGGY-family carbohydrate kinase [Acidimicrobiales bacterium]